MLFVQSGGAEPSTQVLCPPRRLICSARRGPRPVLAFANWRPEFDLTQRAALRPWKCVSKYAFQSVSGTQVWSSEHQMLEPWWDYQAAPAHVGFP